MLVREAGPGEIAVYMTRRSGQSRFVPDAYVFPGGAVDIADSSDRLHARLLGKNIRPGREFAAAALRELFEEAGVLIAAAPDGTPARFRTEQLSALRAELAGGADFADLLTRENLSLDARDLVYYSNWITPLSEPLRFDVHFFLAPAPHGQIASADAVEVHDGRWFTPREALEQADRDELRVIFPTRKHLERLAEYSTLEALFAHARKREPRAIMPYQRDDGEFDLGAGSEAW